MFRDINEDGAPDIYVCNDFASPDRVWINDGSGHFADATATHMPDIKVLQPWDLELLDVDNDWDLDLAISSKRSDTSFLFTNDGAGTFTPAGQWNQVADELAVARGDSLASDARLFALLT